MSKYDFVNQNQPTSTPATAPIPGREHEMVKNQAGGYTFKASGLTMLRRFLILGTSNNQYYVEKRQLTKDALNAITGFLKENLDAAVKEAREISTSNRAISNSPAIFFVAFLFAQSSPRWTTAAKSLFPDVIRTGAHLQEFTSYIRGFRKTGRAVRTTVEKWLEGRNDRTLMYQMLKFQNRQGYGWGDMFALYHPRPKNALRESMYMWARFGGFPTAEYLSNGGKRMPLEQAQKVLADAQKFWDEDEAFKQARITKNLHGMPPEVVEELGAGGLVQAVKDGRLTHEMVTSSPLFAANKAAGWEALADDMPAHALLWSLNALSANEVLTPKLQEMVVDFLHDKEALKRARLHPMQLLKTWLVYKQGRGIKGQMVWTPNQAVVQALSRGFEISVGLQEKLKGRVLIGVDVSGSMYGGMVLGMPFLSPARVSAAYAYIMMQGCEDPRVVYFDYKGSGSGWGNWQACGQHGYKDVTKALRGHKDLDQAIKHVGTWGAGGTDVSLPFEYALVHNQKVDTFILFTDNMSWAGNHAPTVLKDYRNKVNADARVVYCTTAPYGTTLSAPEDLKALDIVGFDPNAATLIEEFHKGNL